MGFFKKILFYFFSIVFLFFVYKNCYHNTYESGVCSVLEKTVESMSPSETTGSDSLNWMKAVQENISGLEYHIRYFSNGKYHQSPNRAHNTRITYFPHRVNIAPRVTEKPENEVQQENSGTKENTKSYENYSLDIAVKGYGTTEAITYPFTSGSLISQNNEAFAQDQHMRVEYINNEQGTRQNFIIQQPVEGDELAVHLTLSTTL
ncbi:MAG: hypothetical protein IT247_08860, partial [Bacteroidia bacterium]|nr:hypothetical protein [Bacteroidia bacterium]